MKGKVYFYAKTLAKIAGHVISMKAVVGDTVRLKSRGLYECISQEASWYTDVKNYRTRLERNVIFVGKCVRFKQKRLWVQKF